MKKQSFNKDMFRTITKSKARFLSIMAIIAIGVSFFAGINATEPDMILSADKYYKDNNLSDFRLISPIGFNDKDIRNVLQTEGISEVQAGYSKDLFLTSAEGNTSTIKLFSYNAKNYENGGGLNKPVLIDGRLPEKSGEIAIEHGVYAREGIKIGSRVTLVVPEGEELDEYLRVESFIVVGIIHSPMYINFERDQTNIGDGSIDFNAYIPEADFTMEKAAVLFVMTSKADNLTAYSKEYKDHLAPIKATLKKLGIDTMQLEIQKLNDKLEENRKDLEEGKKEFEDNRKKLENSKKELEDSGKKLEEGKKELEANKRKLEESKKDLEKGKSELEINKKQLAQKKKELEASKAALSAGQNTNGDAANTGADNESSAISKITQLSEAAQLSQAELATALQKLEAAETEIKNAEAQVKSAEAKLKTAEADLRDGEAKLLDVEAEIKDSESKIKDAESEIKDGEAKLSDAEAEIRDGETKLADAEEQILSIPDEWFVLDRDANPGYAGYGDDAERIGAVAKIFPLFFFLVAALVCLTTMTRMVEEERAEIGTLKALGYSTLTISSKYLVYALLSSLAGALIGLSTGFWLFPNAIMNAYGIMYKIHARLTPYHFNYALISIALAVFTTVSATMLATLQELRTLPAALIQPKAPKPGKRIFLERIAPLWKRLTFIHKVTARNIFRYKRRFLMTVIGISGCTALLVTGFGLKDSINAIMDKQFDEIFIYDGMVMLDIDKPESERNLRSILGENKDVESYIQTFSESGNALAEKSGRSYEVNLLVPEDSQAFENFVSLHERESRKEINLPSDGAVITEKLSKLLDVKIGDIFTYRDTDNATYDIEVKAIAENYLSHYVFISSEYFDKIGLEATRYNSAMFNLKNSDGPGGLSPKDEAFDEHTFKEDLMEHEGVLGVMLTGGMADKIMDSMESLDYVVVILILSAGALAFVVLYNLTNINITERIREIATIKVLGFRDKEVSAYVYRENIILTIIGTALGLLLGILLHKYVIDTMEIDTMMFGRNIHIISYLLSILLTMAFSILVNLFMYYKLRNVNMLESLKSIE